MTRYLVVIDVQEHTKPSAMMVDQLKALGRQLPTVAMVMHEELTDDVQENSLVPGEGVFTHSGYLPSIELVQHLQKQGATEALVVGGFDDTKILAVGTALNDSGIKPIMVPMLCYGNMWYEHSVCIRIWEQTLGKVHDSVVELGLRI